MLEWWGLTGIPEEGKPQPGRLGVSKRGGGYASVDSEGDSSCRVQWRFLIMGFGGIDLAQTSTYPTHPKYPKHPYRSGKPQWAAFWSEERPSEAKVNTSQTPQTNDGLNCPGATPFPDVPRLPPSPILQL